MAAYMDQTSDEDTDMTESELDEFHDYAEKFYEELKNGNHRVKVSEETFICPYCQPKRKRDYMYEELLRHASSVGKSRKKNKRKGSTLGSGIDDEDEKLKVRKKEMGDEAFLMLCQRL